MSRTHTAPSPAAEATRLIEPCRTSPTANTPGIVVSNMTGERSRGDVKATVAVSTGRDVAPGVTLDFGWEPVGARVGADEDEQRCCCDAFDSLGRAVLEVDPFEAPVAATAGDLGLEADVDVRRPFDALDEVVGHARGERLRSHDDGHRLGELSEVECGLAGGVAAADDTGVLACERSGF